MSSFDTGVFVDTDTLNHWGTRLSSINSAALGCIEDFESKTNELEIGFKGSSAEGFISSVSKSMSEAKTSHENMNDVSSFLQLVIDTMEKE